MPKFSIITVCFNAKESIEATILSVINQEYKDFEYIIVDGASSDGTLDVIHKYTGKYDNVISISEPDSGLYDAMNKGIGLATGEYIEFLNAGDRFFDNNVLSRVAQFIDKYRPKESTIFYGNITYEYADATEAIRVYGPMCGKSIYYATGDCINHQSCFASRSCFTADGKDFDTNTYKICADRDWMMRQSKKGSRFIPIGEMIVRYSLDEDSVSVRDKQGLKKEERIAIKRHYPVMYPIYLIFDACRNNKVLAKCLHTVYELLFIRK